jgi:hypothetical protein
MRQHARRSQAVVRALLLGAAAVPIIVAVLASCPSRYAPPPIDEGSGPRIVSETAPIRRALEPRRHASPGAGPASEPPEAATSATEATEPRPVAPWERTLVAQRDIVAKLLNAVTEWPSGDTWSARASVADRVQALSKSSGVIVSLDPDLELHSAKPSKPGRWAEGAPVLNAVRFLSRDLDASPRPTRDGVCIGPRVRDADAIVAGRYADDPFAAFAAMRRLVRADKAFHQRWHDAADCERVLVDLAPDGQFATVAELLHAVAAAMRSPTFRCPGEPSHYSLNPGLRTGTALDVVRSWIPNGTVVTGRATLEVWLDPAAARASAEDKRRYEEVRSVVELAVWDAAPRSVTVRDAVEELARVTGSVAVVDPAVADRSTLAERGERTLQVLERAGIGKNDLVEWTWAAGCLFAVGRDTDVTK